MLDKVIREGRGGFQRKLLPRINVVQVTPDECRGRVVLGGREDAHLFVDAVWDRYDASYLFQFLLVLLVLLLLVLLQLLLRVAQK